MCPPSLDVHLQWMHVPLQGTHVLCSKSASEINKKLNIKCYWYQQNQLFYLGESMPTVFLPTLTFKIGLQMKFPMQNHNEIVVLKHITMPLPCA